MPRLLMWPLLCLVCLAADGWTRFRGPNGSGVSQDQGFPTVFSKEKNVRWRTVVRPGKSSPILTRRHIFLTAFDQAKFYTQCFDRKTGKLLWQTSLPAAGNATPSIYVVNGRAFIVIACGGGKNDAPSGGTYVAFTLGDVSQKQPNQSTGDGVKSSIPVHPSNAQLPSSPGSSAARAAGSPTRPHSMR